MLGNIVINQSSKYKEEIENQIDYYLVKLGDNLFVVEKCLNLSEGLSNRKTLHEQEGMIFNVHNLNPVSFHMKGCLFPLDIIFIKNGLIEKIFHNCPPCKIGEKCKKYTHPSADIVIELLGGTCKKKGITEGLKYQQI